jgi:hypothetical protein
VPPCDSECSIHYQHVQPKICVMYFQSLFDIDIFIGVVMTDSQFY